MTCVRPLVGWRSKSPNDSGRYPVVFNCHGADIDQPMDIPCGQCVGCRSDQSRDWGVRCFHEGLMHERNAFLTLTYANPPVVFDKYDLQCFFKRLRYAGFRFRYFGCGEFGTVSGRPHYHALIFGEDFRGGDYAINDSLYGNSIIDYEWRHGLVSIGSLTAESCFYTAGYCLKKVQQESFSLMSRKPAIGRTFLDKFSADLLGAKQVIINGRKYPVPRKYFDWAYLDPVKDRRSEFVRRLSPDKRWELSSGRRDRELHYVDSVKRKGSSL